MSKEISDIVRERDNWKETAQQYGKNAEFYHSLVTKIGEGFGAAAKTSDDGSVQQDVLALKVPELVDNLRVLLRRAAEKLNDMGEVHLAEDIEFALGEADIQIIEVTADWPERLDRLYRLERKLGSRAESVNHDKFDELLCNDARELIDAAKERDRIKHLMFDSMPGRTIIELKADNDNLRTLLRKFEWAGFNGFDEENCWICKATKFVLNKDGKHAPDCELAAALERS